MMPVSVFIPAFIAAGGLSYFAGWSAGIRYAFRDLFRKCSRAEITWIVGITKRAPK